MKVKVSKVMTKTLQQNIPEYKFTYKTYTPDQYGWYVDVMSSHENDYDYITNKYHVIKITYPDDYYANPTYLTTDDLNKLFAPTLSKFIENIKEEICI